ncbi:MAG: TRAP transporter small permease [Clostridiales Family XIII bacterium]|jgi:TRAP-type C4-dicarboxylate transport system permease small subunit|nr:TRAP transporter small permease [Clostridiales Family XIII bacterium]
MIKTLLDKITSGFTAAASAVLIAVGVITLANILLRTIFNAPISGAVEVVQVGMLIANALALGKAGLLDRHIAVHQLVDWFPKRVGSSFRTVTDLLGLVTFGYVSYYYFTQIKEMAATGRVTEVLKIPIYCLYIVMAVCFLLAAIVFLYWTIAHLIKIIKPTKETPKEGLDAIKAEDLLT